MQFYDKINVSKDRLVIYRVYPDGRKEIAHDTSRPLDFNQWLAQREKKSKPKKWDMR